MQKMNVFERETVISRQGDSQTWDIWTCIPQDINRMRKDGSFTEVESGRYLDGTEHARFTIPVDRWNPVTGRKRKGRTMTEDEKAALADRLRQVGETE